MNTRIMDLDNDPDGIEERVPTQEEGAEEAKGYTPPDDDLEVHIEESSGEEESPKANEDDIESLPYGERVKKRIERERDVTRREREARIAAEERASRLEAELEASRRQKSSVEIDSQISAVKEKIKDAQLSDDALEVAEHTAELANLKRQKTELEAPPARKPEPPARNVAREAWAQRNPWFDTKDYDTQSDIAVAISEKLKREDYDPVTDEFWEELDSRLSNAGVRLPKTQRKPQPVAGVTRDNTAPNKKFVKLDSSDLALLESMGIDRNDKAALRAYAIEKMNNGGAR